jgi:hypothetical protein
MPPKTFGKEVLEGVTENALFAKLFSVMQYMEILSCLFLALILNFTCLFSRN